MYGGRPCHYEKYSYNAAASHVHESELWLAFYLLQLTPHKTRPFERLGVGCRSRPVSFRPVNPNETKGAKYERQKIFSDRLRKPAKPDR